MSTPNEQRLREALVAAIEPLRMYQAYGWPDRNRVIKHCESAIAQQAPTHPAICEPAASVDARDAALLLAQRMCREALPKFNWGASFLDANAIQLLNEAPAAIDAAIARQAAAPVEE